MENNAVDPNEIGCLGVCCPVHAGCQRYAAVEATPAPERRIGTCLKGGARPLFLVQVPAAERGIRA